MSDLADQVIGLYQRHGSAWVAARAAGSFVERAWIDRFLAMVPRGAVILDLGCGAGAPIGRHLVDQGYSVTGVDSAPGMIAHFRANLPEQPALVGDMRHLALITRFAGILAWDSLFHLSHEAQRGMFPIFQAHASPGAPLMFNTGPNHGEAIGELCGEPLYHASLDWDEYRQLLSSHGFRLLAQVSADPDCGGRSVWLAQAGPC